MSELPPAQIPLHETADVVTARRAARELCEQLGFGKADQTRLATAVSELTRNVIQYANHGECVIENRSTATHRCIWVQVRDQGAGIANLEQALTDGYSTSGGLGAGLPGTRRLVDQFHIESTPQGTCITIVLTKPL
ncbi:anti-sigma regulatory factor [Chromatium okenii]|uniref:anti-sigma regulatory factor n=1 Tax=Chromatium okenii TaxID=61644 RepID=UPI0019064550|nr:anti-sigma regulatory factor [Chromatium okenii]MBK1640743.1 anti-sigma regulatory factor [Chromatium okenii]